MTGCLLILGNVACFVVCIYDEYYAIAAFNASVVMLGVYTIADRKRQHKEATQTIKRLLDDDADTLRRRLDDEINR